jgi:allantoinase
MMGSQRDYIGYGDHLPQIRWPDGKKVAVSIVVNYEEGSERSVDRGDSSDETIGELGNFSTMAPTGRNVTVASFFEYGSRVGVWRLLKLFRKHQISATVFACADALEQHPAVARAFVEEGHEICNHGYRWEDHYGFSPEEERSRIRAAQDLLHRVTGARPVGIFINRGITEATRQIIVDEGLLYDSNSYSEDVPYYVRVGERDHLVLPYSADTNDTRFWTSPGFISGEHYTSYLCDTLDVLLDEAETAARMMSIGLHARIAGRPARTRAVERFIEYALSKPDVWFARRDEIARWWLENVPAKAAAEPNRES